MNAFKTKTSRLLSVTGLVALLSMLAACDQVVSSANAQTAASVVQNDVVYVGDEYAVVQARLGADLTPQAPSF